MWSAPAAALSVCLASGTDGGELARHTLAPNGLFELSFIHSVSKTPVVDRYRATDQGIVQTAEIFQTHGAGLPSIANDVEMTGVPGLSFSNGAVDDEMDTDGIRNGFGDKYGRQFDDDDKQHGGPKDDEGLSIGV